MKLADLLDQIVVAGQEPTLFRHGRLTEVRPHRRASWDQRASVYGIGADLYLSANGVTLKWSPSYDDIMADDWEAVC